MILEQTVSESVEALLSRKLSLEDLVLKLEGQLNSPDREQRCLGLQYLADCVRKLPIHFLIRDEVELLSNFFVQRIEDHNSMVPACLQAFADLTGLLTADRDSCSAISQCLLQLPIPSLRQGERFHAYCCISHLLQYQLVLLRENSAEFVVGFVQAIDGEQDPRNLMLVFRLAASVVRLIPLGDLAEQFFDVISCYFPIDFSPPKNDPYGITVDGLKEAFHPYKLQLWNTIQKELFLVSPLPDRPDIWLAAQTALCKNLLANDGGYYKLIQESTGKFLRDPDLRYLRQCVTLIYATARADKTLARRFVSWTLDTLLTLVADANMEIIQLKILRALSELLMFNYSFSLRPLLEGSLTRRGYDSSAAAVASSSLSDLKVEVVRFHAALAGVASAELCRDMWRHYVAAYLQYLSSTAPSSVTKAESDMYLTVLAAVQAAGTCLTSLERDQLKQLLSEDNFEKNYADIFHRNLDLLVVLSHTSLESEKASPASAGDAEVTFDLTVTAPLLLRCLAKAAETTIMPQAASITFTAILAVLQREAVSSHRLLHAGGALHRTLSNCAAAEDLARLPDFVKLFAVAADVEDFVTRILGSCVPTYQVSLLRAMLSEQAPQLSHTAVTKLLSAQLENNEDVQRMAVVWALLCYKREALVSTPTTSETAQSVAHQTAAAFGALLGHAASWPTQFDALFTHLESLGSFEASVLTDCFGSICEALSTSKGQLPGLARQQFVSRYLTLVCDRLEAADEAAVNSATASRFGSLLCALLSLSSSTTNPRLLTTVPKIITLLSPTQSPDELVPLVHLLDSLLPHLKNKSILPQLLVKMLQLISSTHSLKVQMTCLRLLQHLSEDPPESVLPLLKGEEQRVVRQLRSLLDHHKRIVRQQVNLIVNQWAML